MKPRLSLIATSFALCGAAAFPALAGGQHIAAPAGLCGPSVCAAVFFGSDDSAQLIRVSGDDDDDHDDDKDHDKGRNKDHDDDDDDDDCGDDDGACTGAQGNPAPAGTVAPPANGLFGDGAPPVVVTK